MWESAGWIAFRAVVVIVAVGLIMLAVVRLMLCLKRLHVLQRRMPIVGLTLEILANFGMSRCDCLHCVADLLIKFVLLIMDWVRTGVCHICHHISRFFSLLSRRL